MSYLQLIELVRANHESWRLEEHKLAKQIYAFKTRSKFWATHKFQITCGLLTKYFFRFLTPKMFFVQKQKQVCQGCIFYLQKNLIYDLSLLNFSCQSSSPKIQTRDSQSNILTHNVKCKNESYINRVTK